MVSTVFNPFLEGNFAPIHEEIIVNSLEVVGRLPAELSGMFLRNGPNPQFSPIGKYHWFDGDGMLHGVRINDGIASYLNRYIRTRGFEIEKDAGKAIWSGILEPPQFDNPYGLYKNPANTALVWHAGRLLALWEGGEPHAIDLPGLETIGVHNYDGQMISPFTAHPKVDPVTGEMMFFGYSLARPPFVQYSIVSATGELDRTIPIDLPVGAIMHDFAITENYTIFLDLPLTYRPERMAKGEPPLMFERDRSSRFAIVPRHGDSSNIRVFEGPSCYVWHVFNAWEEGDEIILLACRMSSSNAFTPDSPFKDPDADIPRLHRWRFDLGSGKVKEEMLDDVACEFPRINERYSGRKTRYGYAARMADSPLPLFDGLLKYDLDKGTSQLCKFGSGRYGGEAVFAPRPGAVTEDDGWSIALVRDENSKTSELIVLDARDLTAEPVARVILPQRVPYGFHGIWLPGESLLPQA